MKVLVGKSIVKVDILMGKSIVNGGFSAKLFCKWRGLVGESSVNGGFSWKIPCKLNGSFSGKALQERKSNWPFFGLVTSRSFGAYSIWIVISEKIQLLEATINIFFNHIYCLSMAPMIDKAPNWGSETSLKQVWKVSNGASMDGCSPSGAC